MVGLGHMHRNLLIAQTLAVANPGAAILVIAEAREASNFSLPSGVDCLTLPALCKQHDGVLQSRYLDLPLDNVVKLRSEVIHSALLSFNPDLLIVDHLPCGAYQELHSTLKALKEASNEIHFVLGVRDVLEDPEVVQKEWLTTKNRRILEELYDAIWIYSDPRVFDAVAEYSFPRDIAKKATFTGYLDQRARLQYVRFQPNEYLTELGLPVDNMILCVVGGGSDGARLAAAFAESELPNGCSGIIISGPYMPLESRRELLSYNSQKSSIRVLEFVSEPTALIHCADRVIAMGGYNTVCEILSFNKPGLIVPRAKNRKEQIIRATRLANLGLIDFLYPDEVTSEALSSWMSSPVKQTPRNQLALNFGGLDRVTELADEMMNRHEGAVSVQQKAGRSR